MSQKRKNNLGMTNQHTNPNYNPNRPKKLKQATLSTIMAVSTPTYTPVISSLSPSSTSATIQYPRHQSKQSVHISQKPQIRDVNKDAPMVWRSFPSQTYPSSVLAYYSSTQVRKRLIQIKQGTNNQNALMTLDIQAEQQLLNEPFSVPMAAFDLDDTLIKTKSGNVSYARKDEKDWKMAFPNVREKLMQAYDKGYLIVIITNQNQIHGAHDGKHATKFKAVVEQVIQQLNIPGMILVAATQQDEYRKGVGSAMMDLIASLLSKAYDPNMTSAFNKPVKPMVSICLKDSYYVGDAAGRPGDHNKTDAEFAIHCRIHFMTETEYFEV